VSATDPVPGGPLDGIEPIECPHPGAVVLGDAGVDDESGAGLQIRPSSNVPDELVAAVATFARTW
jgi:hypothetical protein